MQNVWGDYVATLEASMIVGIIVVIVMLKQIYGKYKETGLRERVGNLFTASTLFYTYSVLVTGQFFGYPISKAIKEGFGDKRVAILLTILLLQQAVAVMDGFRKPE